MARLQQSIVVGRLQSYMTWGVWLIRQHVDSNIEKGNRKKGKREKGKNQWLENLVKGR